MTAIPHRTIAAYFEMGLLMGIVTQTEVAAWADGILEQIDKPDEWLIELSLSTSKNAQDLIHYLRVVPGDADHDVAFRLLMAKLARYHPRITRQNVDYALMLFRFHEGMSREVSRRIFQIDLDLDLGLEEYCEWSVIEKSYAQLLELGEPFRDTILEPSACCMPDPVVTVNEEQQAQPSSKKTRLWVLWRFCRSAFNTTRRRNRRHSS